MEGKTNFSRRLHRLSETGIVECLEITDVGCNLKQFDDLTRLTLTPYFTAQPRTDISVTEVKFITLYVASNSIFFSLFLFLCCAPMYCTVYLQCDFHNE